MRLDWLQESIPAGSLWMKGKKRKKCMYQNSHENRDFKIFE